jgi:hypothetical protein
MKKIKLEVSKLVASCLQRMIVDEIDNQKRWYQQDLKDGMGFFANGTRTRIIQDMTELADDLEKQGIQKYIKCY